MEMVSSWTQGRGVWAMDRGGDRDKLLFSLIKNNRRFLIRLRNGRHLIWQGRSVNVLELARACPMLHRETINCVFSPGMCSKRHTACSESRISTSMPWPTASRRTCSAKKRASAAFFQSKTLRLVSVGYFLRKFWGNSCIQYQS
jgi:hypothetical protein